MWAGIAAASICLGIAALDEPDRAANSSLICRHPEVVDPENPLECVESAWRLPATEGDREGQLRVVGVYPAETEMKHHIVAVVAGVVSEEAEAAAGENPDPVELLIFFNDAASPFTVRVRPTHEPQAFRFRFESPENYSAEGAPFFRSLFADVWSSGGRKTIALGLSRNDQKTTLPDASAPEGMEVTVLLFSWWAILWGIAAVAFFAASFVFYARRTTLLRENKQTVADLKNVLKDADETKRPKGWGRYISVDGTGAYTSIYDDEVAVGPYSLGLTQMTIWAFLVIVGFLYITLTLGQFQNLVNNGVLVLLGLNGITSIAAAQINAMTEVEEKANISHGFLQDVIQSTDQTGPQFQRINAFVWTLILGGIFLWIAASSFRFVDFDEKLLLLMGIVQSVYIGFKTEAFAKS